jgi:hypothetical protein
MPHEPERLKVLECFASARLGQPTALLETPKDLRHLDVEQMRCVQDLPGRKEKFGESRIRLAAQQQLDRGRGIDDNQRAVLTARTASAELSPPRTGRRPSRRARISSGVGRFARSSSSERR